MEKKAAVAHNAAPTRALVARARVAAFGEERVPPKSKQRHKLRVVLAHLTTTRSPPGLISLHGDQLSPLTTQIQAIEKRWLPSALSALGSARRHRARLAGREYVSETCVVRAQLWRSRALDELRERGSPDDARWFCVSVCSPANN